MWGGGGGGEGGEEDEEEEEEEEEGRQSKMYGSHLVVHRVAFPACVKFMSRQGVIL